MAYFLALQTTYEHLEIGLFQDQKLLAFLQKDRALTSKYITLFFDELLQKTHLTLKDISFFAANTGPTPITSLRVILATLNGLSLATGLPLVSIDGLAEFLRCNSKDNQLTVALFNAFSDDVFFAYQGKKGVLNINTLLQELKQITDAHNIVFIGQGAAQFQEKIVAQCGNQAIIKDSPQYLTLDQLGQAAHAQWQDKLITDQLLPMYVKKREYKSSL